MTQPVSARGGKSVAIMQPYFFPYLGYVGLMARVDEFVVLDSVQFPRRGRVHRCQVPHHGREEWLTLPVAPSARDTLISELTFSPDAQESWRERLAKFPWASGNGDVRDGLVIRETRVADYLVRQLTMIRDLFGLTCSISRSSELDLPEGRDARGRLIKIAQQRGATTYINAAGGRALYADAPFRDAGLTLAFMPPYEGKFQHLLPALCTGKLAEARTELAEYNGLPLIGAARADA